MKRSEQLAPLSRDHHRALFIALQLKRAEDGEPARVLREFVEGDGGRHFAIEERVLLPAWLAADDAADRALATRVLDEHLQLRAAARDLDQHTEPAELRRLGQLLDDHVRFEERELFPLIETALGDSGLTALAAEMDAAERA